MFRIPTLMLILAFTASIMFAQYVVLEEDFEGGEDLPIGWESPEMVYIDSGAGVGGSAAINQYVWIWFGYQINLSLYTPVINNLPAASTLTFDYRIMSSNDIDPEEIGFAQFNVNISNAEMDEEESIWLLTDHVTSAEYRTITIPLDEQAGFTGRFQFHCTPGSEAGFYLQIDNVKITTTTPPPDYDLLAVSVTGYLTPMQDRAYPYFITVKNMGLQTIGDGEYTVTLMQANADGEDVIIGTLPGTELSYTQTARFEYAFTPQTVGTTQFYGVVTHANDANQANNQTPLFCITSLPLGSVYIGDMQSYYRNENLPFGLFYKQSLVQMIYYQHEIHVEGAIEAIGYNFSRGGTQAGQGGYPEAPKPVKIWMATTDKYVFESTDDAIPYADFTLVYEGTIPVDVAGVNDITIPLDTPYAYSSGNLVVMTERLLDPSYYSPLNKWLITFTDYYSRSITYAGSGGAIFDVSTSYPPFQYTEDFIPNTSFTFGFGPFATVNGTVTDIVTGLPIQGVEVSLQGTSRKVQTNEYGEFTFNVLPEGLHSFTLAKHGYYSLSVDNISAIHSEITTIQGLQMTGLPTVTVSGKVLASDTNEGLLGAIVTLNGYENYQTTTDFAGDFAFMGVYADQTYTLAVSATNYHTYQSNVAVESADVSLPPITLSERINPPQNVVATVDETDVSIMNITWEICQQRTALMPSLQTSASRDTIYGVRQQRTALMPSLQLTTPFIPSQPNTRSLNGYNIYRASQDSLESESHWVTIATDITETAYADTTWGTVASGNYYYIVRCVYTEGLSAPVISNIVSSGVSVTINVFTYDNAPAVDASVTLQNNTFPDFVYHTTVTNGNTATLQGVAFGTYTLTVSKNGYYPYVNPSVTISGENNIIQANLGGTHTIFYQGFDDPDLQMPLGWTHTANESSFPWQIVEATYTYAGSSVFPFTAHNDSFGMAASQSFDSELEISLDPDNWLITPQIAIPADSFGARLEYYIATYSNWRDHYGVYASTTGTAPEVFTLLFEETPPGGFHADQVWTNRIVNLSDYVGQDIYIAFRHFDSYDNYWLMLDDVRVVASSPTSTHDEAAPVLWTTLKSNYPNPFNPSTTISFDIAKEGRVAIDVFNIKGQLVKTLADDVYGAGSHKVIWNGDDASGRTVGSGVYFYRMTTEQSTYTKKMMLMK